MGLIHTNIDLSNPVRRELAALRVEALADTGAITLCIPEHIAAQLDLPEIERREVELATGSCVSVPYVGPIRVGFGNRSCFTGALVLGKNVLLGAIPMEDMDLVVDPGRRQVTVNPASPNVPSAVVMALTSDPRRRWGRRAACRRSGSRRWPPALPPTAATPRTAGPAPP